MKKGDNINDLSLIMGKGNISAKGKVLSSDNLPIKGVKVSFNSTSRLPSELADGDCITDKNGNFLIIGFKNAVEVEIWGWHEIYGDCKIIKKLIPGENRFVIKLAPRKARPH